jgi:hypothetical protein
LASPPLALLAQALAIIVHKGVGVVKDALIGEKDDHVKVACVWTLGQLGRHTPDHSKALTEGGCLAPMVVLLSHPESSDDLRLKCKRALKAVVLKCTDAAALAPLLRDANGKVAKYALAQFAALLPHDAAARKAFMASGLLQRVQELKAAAPPKVLESVARVNACFPEEAVRFSDPEYAREILARMDG